MAPGGWEMIGRNKVVKSKLEIDKLKQKLKNKNEEIKDLRQQIKSFKTSLSPYRDNLNAAHTEIKVLRDELHTCMHQEPVSSGLPIAASQLDEERISAMYQFLMNNTDWVYNDDQYWSPNFKITMDDGRTVRIIMDCFRGDQGSNFMFIDKAPVNIPKLRVERRFLFFSYMGFVNREKLLYEHVVNCHTINKENRRLNEGRSALESMVLPPPPPYHQQGNGPPDPLQPPPGILKG